MQFHKWNFLYFPIFSCINFPSSSTNNMENGNYTQWLLHSEGKSENIYTPRSINTGENLRRFYFRLWPTVISFPHVRIRQIEIPLFLVAKYWKVFKCVFYTRLVRGKCSKRRRILASFSSAVGGFSAK